MENFRMHVFRVVAQEMSFRRAAEILHLSQPAVSQNVRALEEELGVRLFDRGGGGGEAARHGSQIALTEAGSVLLGFALRGAELAIEAKKALAGLNGNLTGALRLGASTTVAQYVLPRILGAFLRQHPEVELSVVSGNTEQVVEAVIEGRVALGIIEGPAMRREVKVEPMVGDEMVLIASPNHPWAKRGEISMKELDQAALLLRERGSGSRRVVERALAKNGMSLKKLRVAMELDSTEAILSGVEAELGVGFCSRWALGKVLRLGTVKVVKVTGLEIRRDFSFVRLGAAEGVAEVFQRFARAAVAG